MNCQSCGRALGCQCQRRIRPDGTTGCTSCVNTPKSALPAPGPKVLPQRVNVPRVNPPIVNRAYWTRRQPAR